MAHARIAIPQHPRSARDRSPGRLRFPQAARPAARTGRASRAGRARLPDRRMGAHSPLLRRLRHAHATLDARALPAMPQLRPARLSAHLAGDDGADQARRAHPAGAPCALRHGALHGPGRFCRGWREHRGRGAPRSRRGGRPAAARLALFRQPVLALPALPDDRLHGRVRRRRDPGAGGRDFGCPVVRPGDVIPNIPMVQSIAGRLVRANLPPGARLVEV